MKKTKQNKKQKTNPNPLCCCFRFIFSFSEIQNRSFVRWLRQPFILNRKYLHTLFILQYIQSLPANLLLPYSLNGRVIHCRASKVTGRQPVTLTDSLTNITVTSTLNSVLAFDLYLFGCRVLLPLLKFHYVVVIILKKNVR